jgi:hypothetical protein
MLFWAMENNELVRRLRTCIKFQIFEVDKFLKIFFWKFNFCNQKVFLFYFKRGMSSFDYPTSGERLNNAQRDQLLEQVKQQVALASAQELIQVEYISVIL